AGIDSGGPLSDGIPATIAHINPSCIAVGPDGSLYIADGSSRRIRRVDPNGIIATIAGNGDSANTGDGGQAWFAGLGAPVGIAVGPDSSLYVVDNGNYVVRRITPNGIITTVA